jgi:hypothetical protein
MYWDDWKFRRKVKRLHQEREKLSRTFDAEIRAATEAKDRERVQSLHSEMGHELGMVGSEIQLEQHKYITKHANLLLVPLPPFKSEGGEWEELYAFGSWILTPQALAHLRREVRQERRERIEMVFLWPASFIGFVGGIVGIVSAFL